MAFSVDLSTDLNTELLDVAKLFFGDELPHITLNYDGDFTVAVDGSEYKFNYPDYPYNLMPSEHRFTRQCKIALYDGLSAFLSRKMPWGALTGVRPTKLFYELMRRGFSSEQATKLMQDMYRVSDSRAQILSTIYERQKGKVEFSADYYNLYVHIPYCTSRCSYCSFVSMPISKCVEQARVYVSLLCDEIKRSLDLMARNNKKLLSVYIGGGTPTALDSTLFDELLSAIGNPNCEYTCEAGRPDTVTREKCDIMKKYGVTRVCVNPQTLNDITLTKIGRAHSSKDFFDVYELVKSYGFDINCDLIAGLPDEYLSDFIYSFDGVKALMPQNITVHSLSKKNGAAMRYETGTNSETSAMVDYALCCAGSYKPYYLYRQKRQAGNLENVGFSLENYECVNNITTMEETVTVLACGAGAISKITDGVNIKRFAAMRDVGLYIERYEQKLKQKLDEFCKVLSLGY